jgi:mono/diheme cytochrome c family protein
MRRNNLPIPAVAFALCAAFAIVAGLLVLHGSDDQANHVTVLGTRVALTKSQTVGHQVFAEHCAACHPSDATVLHYVKYGAVGRYGAMDGGLATGPDLYAVASYVSHVANPSAYHR